MELLERAKDYIAKNAAESGADALIAEMIKAIESDRASLKRLRELVKKAADWIDPDCSPPALYSEHDIVAELRNAAESSAIHRRTT